MTDSSSLNTANWQASDAKALYNLERWSEGYVDVSDNGHLLVRPYRDERQVDLAEVLAALPQSQLRLPVLLRFVDILRDRVQSLCDAFDHALEETLDKALLTEQQPVAYSIIYPIKVNQQADVIREIAEQLPGRVGLEAGSKPELLAVLGMALPGAPIICNGYKDDQYIQLANIGARMGHAVTLVIEKPSEIAKILASQGELQADIGLRVRLASIAAGNWQNTGGGKSKFGLTSSQLLQAVTQLKAANALPRLQLLHLHLGSQVANIDDIRRGIAEAARVYCDLRDRGAPIKVLDVGGGLGVDYEGTASRSYCSMNYSMADYAQCIVTTIASVCKTRKQPMPDLMSESGRALTAHHAMLVTNVVDAEAGADNTMPGNESEQEAFELLKQITALQTAEQLSWLERYQQLYSLLNQVNDAYAAGVINLTQRAAAEEAGRQASLIMRDGLTRLLNSPGRHTREQRELLDELEERLAEKYFVNLSIFQSMPDIWALDQIFPILPINRLHERPDRRAALCDLTCDSDGRIDRYVDFGGIESTLPVHALKADEDYCLGFFMVGAYQEILGDMHNLFGDTDAVNVVLTDTGWVLQGAEYGDQAADLLRYVHLDPEGLSSAWREKLLAQDCAEDVVNTAMQALQDGLSGYTYLQTDSQNTN